MDGLGKKTGKAQRSTRRDGVAGMRPSGPDRVGERERSGSVCFGMTTFYLSFVQVFKGVGKCYTGMCWVLGLIMFALISQAVIFKR